MAVNHKNRVKMTVSGTPGTGTITLNAASSGYQTFAAAYAGNATVDVLLTDGTAWEVARACTYTNSGTTLTRGTLEASSTGSAISLTSAAVVEQIPTAQWGNWLESAMQAVTPGGRLTLTSGTPVTTSDVTGATNIYYTPYLHDTIPLWDGARWVPVTFAETTEALGTLTSGLPYDVFGFLSSGVLDLEKLAWTNGTTRATAVTLQDGRYCKSGDKTRLYLGTFYTTATTTTEDSDTKRFLFNFNNQQPRRLFKAMSGNWTYTTNTYRQANADTSYQVEVCLGIASEINLTATHLAGGNTTGIGIRCSIGEDSTSSSDASVIGKQTNLGNTVGDYREIIAFLRKNAAVGYHKYVILEACDATGTTTWYGSTGAEPSSKNGLSGQVMA